MIILTWESDEFFTFIKLTAIEGREEERERQRKTDMQIERGRDRERKRDEMI